MPPWGSHTLSPTRLYTPLHTQERGGVETMKRRKKRRVRRWKIRGEGMREVSPTQALKLLDLLLLSRLLSYPLSSQLLNQQGGSQFKHLTQGSPLG